MSMNENIIKGKWLEIKGEVLKAWGRLNNDELDKTKGDINQIVGLIQQKYGDTQDKYNKKLNELIEHIVSNKDKIVDDVKKSVHPKPNP